MIAITIDVEWAPDVVLKDTLDLLEKYNIDATLFSTHSDPFAAERHERAIHPNFDKDDPTTVLEEIYSLYPEAVGLRSHRMQVSTTLRMEWVTAGIEYESNYIQYRKSGIEPFEMPEGTVQFPVYWMDDVWFRSDGEQLEADTLLKPSGLKVFDFHPPHIYFNTPNISYYLENKKEYWKSNPDTETLRYGGFGVRDIFLDLLKTISERDADTKTLMQIYEKK